MPLQRIGVCSGLHRHRDNARRHLRLAAIGLVLIYRVSGVLNFAQGAVSMFSAFIAYQISIVMGIRRWSACSARSSPVALSATSSSASRSVPWPAARR